MEALYRQNAARVVEKRREGGKTKKGESGSDLAGEDEGEEEEEREAHRRRREGVFPFSSLSSLSSSQGKVAKNRAWTKKHFVI